MTDPRELERLRTLEADLDRMEDAVNAYEEYFVMPDCWYDLQEAISACRADVEALIETRQIKYRVLGIATEHLNDNRREPLTAWKMNSARCKHGDPAPDYDTYDEALDRLREVKGTMRDKEGYDKYLFYIKEVNNVTS